MFDPEPGNPSREHSTGSFWTTLPGILTGLAALITAIVGLVSLLRAPGPASSDPGDSASAGVSGPAAAAVDPQPSDSLPGILIERRIVMKSTDNVDLETGVTGDPDGVDLYLFCDGTNCILNAMQSLMTVADGAESRESCVAALESRQEQALTSADLRPDRTLCVQTADGHVGRLRLVDVPRPGSVDFVFSYTLWR